MKLSKSKLMASSLTALLAISPLALAGDRSKNSGSISDSVSDFMKEIFSLENSKTGDNMSQASESTKSQNASNSNNSSNQASQTNTKSEQSKSTESHDSNSESSGQSLQEGMASLSDGTASSGQQDAYYRKRQAGIKKQIDTHKLRLKENDFLLSPALEEILVHEAQIYMTRYPQIMAKYFPVDGLIVAYLVGDQGHETKLVNPKLIDQDYISSLSPEQKKKMFMLLNKNFINFLKKEAEQK